MGALRKPLGIAGWALLGLWLAGDYALFRDYVQREVAWGYPRMWDQASLLANAYATHETWEREGAAAALSTAWRRRAPQGALIFFETAALMQVLGASRLTALTLVFLHYALLQVALVATLRRLAPGWTAPALALGLLWSLRSPAWWGGLADFRLDFMALCLQGAWLCLALRSDSLASRRGAALAGAVAAGLAVFRYVTFVYTLATLMAFVAVELLVGRSSGSLARARAKGAMLALGIVTLGGVPFFWVSREQLRAYYWKGHVELGDPLAPWSGLFSAADVWLYYPRALRDHHAGPTCLALAALTLVVAAGVGLAARRRGSEARPAAGGTDLAAAARLLGCATLAPLLVLAASPAKSPVVANVLLPGLVLLVTLPVAALLRRGLGRPALRGLAVVALAAGLAHHVAFLRGPGPLNSQAADSRAITALHEAIARAGLERGWTRPFMLVDDSGEHTLRWNTSVVAYERFGELIEPRVPLGGLPWTPVDAARLGEWLPRIQIAVVTREAGPGGAPLPPFDSSMAALRPSILAACQRDFVSLGRFAIRGGQVELFARRAPRGSR